MKLTSKEMSLVAGAIFLFPAFAKTTTWQGGASGDFSTGNWSDGAPASGDTAVFSGSSEVTITGSFDVGASGIVIDNSCKLTVQTVFSGSGKLTKKGAGEFRIAAQSTHAGGTRVENGFLVCNNSITTFGTGTIELVRYSDSLPYFKLLGSQFNNNFQIIGAITSTQGAFVANYGGDAVFNGSITADSDFTIGHCGGWGGANFKGAINAPGHAVNIYALCGTAGTGVTLSGAVNATVKKVTIDDPPTWAGKSASKITSKSTGFGNSLVVEYSGPMTLTSSAEWGGTNVVVDGAKSTTETVLELQGESNLSPAATLRVANGGLLKIANGVTIKVSHLIIDGQEQPADIYDATSLSSVITGGGSLDVRPRKLWIGGAAGVVDAPANWSDGKTPQSGDILVFTGSSDVTIQAGGTVKGGLDVGSDGITIDNSCTVSGYMAIWGSGKLIKTGPGEYKSYSTSPAHSGGTRIENGVFTVLAAPVHGSNPNATYFGHGNIELIRFSDERPTFKLRLANESTLNLYNSFVIHGAITKGEGAIYANSPSGKKSEFDGSITADADFLIHGQWGGAIFYGNINAPGHTVNVFCNTAGGGIDEVQLCGSINANVRKMASSA